MLGTAVSPSPHSRAMKNSFFYRAIANQGILSHSATTGAGEVVRGHSGPSVGARPRSPRDIGGVFRMRTKRTLFGLATILAAGLVLSACDEDEQGRILRYEKGTYLGPTDQALSSDQVTTLRARSRLQEGK